MIRRGLRGALVGACCWASFAPLNTYVPMYFIGGHDVTWVVMTAEGALYGAVAGFVLGCLFGGPGSRPDNGGSPESPAR